jgi:hypothetical protein
MCHVQYKVRGIIIFYSILQETDIIETIETLSTSIDSFDAVKVMSINCHHLHIGALSIADISGKIGGK